MDVLSRKVSMGLVRLRISRNRRSMALVVLTCFRSARVLQRKQASRSSRSLRREETALRVESPGTKPDRTARSISGARLAQLFGTSLGQKGRVRSAGSAGIEVVEPAVHRLGHPALDDPGQCLPAERATALAPFQSARLHLLHHLERLWQTFDRYSLPWHRGAPDRGCLLHHKEDPLPTDT